MVHLLARRQVSVLGCPDGLSRRRCLRHERLRPNRSVRALDVRFTGLGLGVHDARWTTADVRDNLRQNNDAFTHVMQTCQPDNFVIRGDLVPPNPRGSAMIRFGRSRKAFPSDADSLQTPRARRHLSTKSLTFRPG